MGRYINGDINRKLWFAVQSSDAADRFGVTGNQPEELYYYFDKANLKTVNEELKKIEETIGLENIAKIRKFFEKTNGYNDKTLKEAKIFEIYEKHKQDYADYELGIDIRDCIIENGSCEFTAEL